LFALAAAIENNEHAALPVLNQAFYQIKDISKFNESCLDLNKRLESVLIELEDIKNDAEKLAEKTELRRRAHSNFK
jgi:DNA repair ATPase RecN